jgi:hypothetical protein
MTWEEKIGRKTIITEVDDNDTQIAPLGVQTTFVN